MKEQLITFETAKLAKEKGFNIKVVNEYNYKGELFESVVDIDIEDIEDVYSAPSQGIL